MTDETEFLERLSFRLQTTAAHWAWREDNEKADWERFFEEEQWSEASIARMKRGQAYNTLPCKKWINRIGQKL